MNAPVPVAVSLGGERRGAGVLPVLVLAIAAAGFFLPRAIGLAWTWLVVAALALALFAAAGIALGKGWRGVLIDPATNTMSLSRLQVVLWTWLALSSFVTLALARVADWRLQPGAYASGPLEIRVPPLLWALMGISLTSAVGAPLLKAAKAQRTAEREEIRVLRARRSALPDPAGSYRSLLDARGEIDPRLREKAETPAGAVYRNKSWLDAAFSDVLTGDEVSTYGFVDVAKIQNLFLTAIAIVAYAAAIVSAMASTGVSELASLPPISEGLVVLIGISHGGYLVDKAVTHTL